MECPVENTFFIKKRGVASEVPFLERVGVTPLVGGTPLAGVTPLVVLKEVTSPMGYVAGYVTCCGTGYVTKKYLVFNFATVIPRTSVAMINLFVPAKIAKTREPSFVKIQASKIFGSIRGAEEFPGGLALVGLTTSSPNAQPV